MSESLDDFRSFIQKSIKTEEKKLTKQYTGKWMEYTVQKKSFIFEKTKIQFKTVFKIEGVRFISTKQNDKDFLRYLYFYGKDSLGKTRYTTVSIDDITVYDDEASIKLLQALDTNE